ncbi:MAG: ABC transporter permease [Gemmatimonadota bacterium]
MRSLFEALWWLLLRLHPREFRSRYGQDMHRVWTRMLEQAAAQPRGAGRALWAVRLRGLLDVTLGGVRARWKGDLRAARPDDEHRTNGGGHVLGNWLRDLRVALRGLRHAPLFSLIAAGSLAIGIAANTTVFSAANALLFRPLPGVGNYDRVVELGRSFDGSGFDTFAYPDYSDVRDQVSALASTSAFTFELVSLSQGAEGTRAIAFAVEPTYFSLLGAPPGRGRYFLSDESTTTGNHPVVVLSHRYWQDRMGADPDVLGATLHINRLPYTVVGVAPAAFRGHMVGAEPDVYIPLSQVPLLDGEPNEFAARNASWHLALGLLAPGADLDRLNEELATVGARLASAYPATNARRSFRAVPLGPIPGNGRGGVRLFITALLAMVSLILMVTCTNVAGMFLARATSREHEMSVRLALGASRARLIQQLTVETLVVFALGGGLGVLLAGRVLAGIRPDTLPIPIPLHLDLAPDYRVLGFAAGITLLTGLVFGLLPALRSTRTGLAGGARGEGRSGGARAGRMRLVFAAAQVGFSLILLVAAGLFVRSLQRAAAIETGFQAEGAWVTALDLTLDGYDEERGRIFQTRLLEALRGQPWVTQAALASDLPLDLSSSGTSVVPEGWDMAEGNRAPFGTDFNRVSDGYFETLRMPVRRGRTFLPADARGSTRVVVVSESFAANAWPDGTAVGRSIGIRVQDGDSLAVQTWEVVGVVADTKNQLITDEAQPFLYFPLPQEWTAATQVVVRSDALPDNVFRGLRSTLLDLDPNLSLGAITTLGQYTAVGILPQRIAAWLTSGLGVLALLLSGLGIYGVVSYSVGLRRREIGIRMALGADRSSVAFRFLGGGFLLALPGLLIGGALSVVFSRLLRSLLLDLSPYDPVALGTVSALLLTMVLLAAWIPARRAALLDPAESLREE